MTQATGGVVTVVPMALLAEAVSVNGISVTATDSADLLEQTTVNLTTVAVPIAQLATPIGMVGISASPTYAYTDGAPIAAPEPEQQTVEQWSIT